jgi:hypothetical protein
MVSSQYVIIGDTMPRDNDSDDVLEIVKTAPSWDIHKPITISATNAMRSKTMPAMQAIPTPDTVKRLKSLQKYQFLTLNETTKQRLITAVMHLAILCVSFMFGSMLLDMHDRRMEQIVKDAVHYEMMKINNTQKASNNGVFFMPPPSNSKKSADDSSNNPPNVFGP